jgi:ABC-type phosphate transport system substrate-binding protein
MVRVKLRSLSVLAAAVVAVGAALFATSVSATAADSHAQIAGDRSTWASNAVNQWVSDTTRQGLQVGYTSTGSAAGRWDFATGLTDFGVTDRPY